MGFLKYNCQMRIARVAALVGVLFVASVSTAQDFQVPIPTAQAYLSKWLLDNTQGNLALASFNKTDGQSSAAFGIKHYKMKASVTLKYRHDFTWCLGSFFHLMTKDGAGCPFEGLLKSVVVRSGKAGETYPATVVLYFQRTERGWDGGEGGPKIVEPGDHIDW